jgi:hypothetical protein
MLFSYADIVFNLYAAIHRRNKAEDEGPYEVYLSAGLLQGAKEKEGLDQSRERARH